MLGIARLREEVSVCHLMPLNMMIHDIIYMIRHGMIYMIYYSTNWLVFITTQMKSVYSAVRTGSLNKAVCGSALKG
jgi:hypothetical protein